MLSLKLKIKVKYLQDLVFLKIKWNRTNLCMQSLTFRLLISIAYYINIFLYIYFSIVFASHLQKKSQLKKLRANGVILFMVDVLKSYSKKIIFNV